VQRLAPRWFVLRNAHASAVGPLLLNPRHTMSLMRGPMTRTGILRARQWRATIEGTELPPVSSAKPVGMVEMGDERAANAFEFAE
jgi:hypothetical protein